MVIHWIKYVAAGICLGLAVRAIHDQKPTASTPANEATPASSQELRMAQSK